MALTKISGGVLQQPINIGLISGNVGIGSTQPTEVLDVNGNISIVPNSGIRGIYIGDGTRDGIGQLICDQNRSNADKNILSVQGKWANTQVASIFFQTGSDTVNKDEGYIEFKTRNGESGAIPTRMTLSKEGNLGIGLTNPSAGLEVRGTADAPTLTWNGSGQTIIGDLTNQLSIGRLNSSPFSLYLQGRASNNAARDILLNPAGGDVGIGTDNPSKPLQVHSDSASAVLVTGATPQIRFNSNVGDGTDADRVILGRATGNDQFITGSVDGDAILRCATSKKVMIGYGTTEIAQFNSSGLKFKTSGMGIDFSATGDGSGTTDSELLDDYEEGTWTPTVVNGTGTFDTTGSTAAWCHYTKIGKRVWLDGYCRIATMDDTSNTFEIGGVPFTPMDPGTGGFTGSVMADSITWATGTATQLVSYITDTTGGVRFYGCQNNTSWNVVQNVDLNAADSFYFNVSYLVA